ncbi:MAG: M56 family metallopeptidase [Rhodothermales bacterium]
MPIFVEIAGVLEAFGRASLAAFWLPLVAWTLVALPCYLALRLGNRAHPLVPYHAGRAVLLALPAGLLLAAVTDVSALFGTSEAAQVFPLVFAMPGVTVSQAAPDIAWSVYHALGALTALAAAMALVRLLRLGTQVKALRRLRQTLSPASPDVQAVLDRLARQHRVGRPVAALVSPLPVVPMTFGWRRPAIVVPASLTGEALRLTLVHELAHVRRRDYVVKATEEVIGAVFFVHPLVAGLRRAITAWRERCCDADVLAQPEVSRKRYAALLLDLTDAPAAPNRLALSMADTPSNLKTRILAMNRLSNHHLNPKWLGFGLGTLLLGTAALVVACTDVIGVNETESASLNAAPSDETFMIVEDMPSMLPNDVEGMKKLQECIRYPEIAKEAGIEGRVFVQFVVDEEGNVTDPFVQKGVHEALDAEALRVMETVKFTPGREDGEPVKVKLALPFNFKLPADTTGTAPSFLEAPADTTGTPSGQ